MPNVALHNIAGENIGEIALSENVFGAEVNQYAVHEVVKAYLANQRQGTQSALTRAEVRGGGIKIYRIVVTTASIIRSLKSIQGHGNSTRAVKLNKFGKRMALSREEMDRALSFVIVYTGVFVVGSFVFSLCGASIGDAVFDFASCLGNVGVGIGFINPGSSPLVLMTGALGMLLGRLEIIPVFSGIHWLITMIRRGGRL